jgi:hypothetical protein
LALEVARGKTFHDVMIVKGRYGVLQNITLYCILSATNAARIYILSYAILYREIARVFVSFLGGGGGGGTFELGLRGKVHRPLSAALDVLVIFFHSMF